MGWWEARWEELFGHREEGELGETKREHVGRRGEAEEKVLEVYF